MPVFESQFEIPNRSVADVASWPYASPSDIFRVLAPPGVAVTIERPMEKVANGAIFSFTMWFGGCFPVSWTAVHEQVTADGFVDIMTDGPLKSWKHTHRFVPCGDGSGTLVKDRIEYEHSALWTYALFNPIALKVMFAWRSFATRRGLQAVDKQK